MEFLAPVAMVLGLAIGYTNGRRSGIKQGARRAVIDLFDGLELIANGSNTAFNSGGRADKHELSDISFDFEDNNGIVAMMCRKALLTFNPGDRTMRLNRDDIDDTILDLRDPHRAAEAATSFFARARNVR